MTTTPAPGTATATVAAARTLGPGLAARSAAIEANRTLPADVVADLQAADLFRLFVPADLGGPELAPQDALDVMEEVAFHDGAAGWCVMISATTGLVSASMPEDHARAVYADPGSIVGGFAAPMGRATVVDGGLRISGRWQWGSGIRHCTAIGGGCLLVGPDGTPTARADGLIAPFAFFDRADVEVLDTWHVAGLQGTGSTDYTVTDAFVPEGRWAQLGAGRPVRGGALYRMPFFGLFALGVTAVSLGIARRAVAEIVDLAGTKRPAGSSRPLAERGAIQADIARAEAIVAASRAFVADAVGIAWDTVQAGDEVSVEHRRRLRLAATHGTQEAARAVDLAYTAAGGAAVYLTSPIQRAFRDVHVATQHAITAPRTFELAGRLALGLETDTRNL